VTSRVKYGIGLKNDLFARPFAIERNAIDTQRPVSSRYYGVQSTTSDGDDALVTMAIPCGVASSKKNEAHAVEDDDPDPLRAQIDSGALTPCADQWYVVHKYSEFSPEHLYPVSLMPASEGSDIVPKGIGYLHVPAPNAQVHVHGTSRRGKFYSRALISLELDAHHRLATSPVAVAIASDAELASACQRAIIRVIYAHQEGDSSELCENLCTLSVAMHQLPFYEYIHQNLPVLATQAETCIDGKRGFDDFALACTNEGIAEHFSHIFGERLKLPYKSVAPFEYSWLLLEYNDVDFTQTCGYERCTSRVLETHGWEVEGKSNANYSLYSARTIPMSPDDFAQVCANFGHPEGTIKYSGLSTKMGFTFRTLLGELSYPYFTCRPGAGYAFITLPEFSIAPAKINYDVLKHLAKCLLRIFDWSLFLRRTIPDPSMPSTELQLLVPPDNLPTTQLPIDLTCYSETALDDELRRCRSTAEYAFVLCGTTLSYQNNTRTISASSSTEAEFLAAEHAKCLRAVSKNLGSPQNSPTSIFKDNMSAIKMINAKVPTTRSQHIAIQSFAVQDWNETLETVMNRIPAAINPSEDLTKPLGWVLHARHTRRMMGHYG
jgi:hypothetical protein